MFKFFENNLDDINIKDSNNIQIIDSFFDNKNGKLDKNIYLK
jgi:hypothetical protein